MQDAVVGACFFAVRGRVVGGGGVAGEDVALGAEVGDKGAVGAEEHNGVHGDEDGGEDAGDDGVGGYALVGAVGGEREEKGRDERGGQGGAAVVLFLNDSGEDECEGYDGYTGELVDG